MGRLSGYVVDIYKNMHRLCHQWRIRRRRKSTMTIANRQLTSADLQSQLQVVKCQLTICNSLSPICNPDYRSANAS